MYKAAIYMLRLASLLLLMWTVSFRDFYSKEKSRMQEQLRQFDDDLRLTRSTLRKELDWKEKMDKNYQQLVREKRDFMSQ